MPISSKKLAFCSWSVQPTSCDELIEKINQAGLNRIQLHLNPISEKEAGWENAQQKLADAGVVVVSGMLTTLGEDYTTLETIKETGGVYPDSTWEQNLAIAKRAADTAKAFGLSIVSLHAGFIPHDPADVVAIKLRDRMIEISDYYDSKGLKISLETGQETAEDLIVFLKAIDRENVGVNFDPANMILYAKGDPIESMVKLMPYVHQVHIKDANVTNEPGTWGTEEAAGAGQVDWQAFIDVLNENAYDGDMVIEREAGDNRIGDIKKAVRYITPLCG